MSSQRSLKMEEVLRRKSEGNVVVEESLNRCGTARTQLAVAPMKMEERGHEAKKVGSL